MNIDLPLDGKHKRLLKGLSRALFGGDFVLEVLLVMALNERFYGGQLSDLTKCEGSYASNLLKRLASVELIEQLPQEPGQLRKYYKKRPSPLWDAVPLLAESVLDQPQSNVSHLPTSA